MSTERESSIALWASVGHWAKQKHTGTERYVANSLLVWAKAQGLL